MLNLWGYFGEEQQWHPTPVLVPGKSHGRRSLEGRSPWGRWGSDTTERLHFHFSLSCIGEGNGNPLQYSCLENPRDGGAWWAAVHWVTQSRTRLKRLSSSSSRLLINFEKEQNPVINYTEKKLGDTLTGWSELMSPMRDGQKCFEMWFLDTMCGVFQLRIYDLILKKSENHERSRLWGAWWYLFSLAYGPLPSSKAKVTLPLLLFSHLLWSSCIFLIRTLIRLHWAHLDDAGQTSYLRIRNHIATALFAM